MFLFEKFVVNTHYIMNKTNIKQLKTLKINKELKNIDIRLRMNLPKCNVVISFIWLLKDPIMYIIII